MQTANDADGGNIFPDITAEEAGYSAVSYTHLEIGSRFSLCYYAEWNVYDSING